MMVKVMARFSDADHTEFESSYSRVSRWAKRHDKSALVNYVAPDVADLEIELGNVDTWFKRVRGYKIMIADLKPYPAMKDSGVPWLGAMCRSIGTRRKTWRNDLLTCVVSKRHRTHAKAPIVSRFASAYFTSKAGTGRLRHADLRCLIR